MNNVISYNGVGLDADAKSSIMRRVRFIYVARAVVRPIIVEGVIFAGAMITILLSVSIPDIAGNFYNLERMTMYSGYFADAFMHTQFLVQATFVLTAVSGAFLLKDSFKNFRDWRRVRVA